MSDLVGGPGGNGRAANGGARTAPGPVPVPQVPPSGIRTPQMIMNQRRERESRRAAEADAARAAEDQRRAQEEERRKSAERRAQAAGVAGQSRDPGYQRPTQAVPARAPGDGGYGFVGGGGPSREPERVTATRPLREPERVAATTGGPVNPPTVAQPPDASTGTPYSRPRAASQSQQQPRPVPPTQPTSTRTADTQRILSQSSRMALEAEEVTSEKLILESEKALPFKGGFVGNFGTAGFTDLQLKSRSETFNVHKKVLCSRSEFFGKACKGGFKEASSGVIDLSEDDPEAVKAMLQFCYTTDYTYDTALHAKVYAIAEKYNIKPLKDLARTKFETAADRDWDSPYFPTTIDFVYTSTPPNDRGLRDIVVKLSRDHLKSLLYRPGFESMMEDNGDFGKDLVKAIAYRVDIEPGAATYKCGACGKLTAAWLNPNQSIACPSCGAYYTYASWSGWKQ